ncbi:hypothetical protein IFR05_003170 [Cadophora sp. M221]|nr:hypothetical protein IFR05_003170 [Cadophora sp. M221]
MESPHGDVEILPSARSLLTTPEFSAVVRCTASPPKHRILSNSRNLRTGILRNDIRHVEMVTPWTRTERRRDSNAPGSEHVEMKEPGEGQIQRPSAYGTPAVETPTLEGVNGATGPIPVDIDIDDTKLSWYGWFVPIVAALAGALFGFDTGTIGHVLPHLNEAFGGTSTAQKAAIMAMAPVGALLGGLLVLLSDKHGRKAVMYLSAALHILGVVLQTTPKSVLQMIFARIVIGLSIGAASAVSPMYIAEIAPAKFRGKMAAMFNFAITGTQLAGYGIGIGLSDTNHGWRICLFGEKAEAAVQKLRPNATKEQVTQYVQSLSMCMETAQHDREGRSNWAQFKQLFTKNHRMKTFAACGLLALSQLSGFNSLMDFAPTLLVALGFSPIIAVAISETNLAVTAIYMTLVDRIGRRRILLNTSPIMFFSLIITDDLADAIMAGTAQKPSLDKTSFIILGTMVGMVVSYVGAIGNLAWTSTEFFPTELRPYGTMLMNMCNWGPNILVSGTFLPLFEKAGAPATSGIYAAFSALGTVFAYFFYPEVKGLSLETIQEIFASKESVVKAANRKQRELRGAGQNRGQLPQGEDAVWLTLETGFFFFGHDVCEFFLRFYNIAYTTLSYVRELFSGSKAEVQPTDRSYGVSTSPH